MFAILHHSSDQIASSSSQLYERSTSAPRALVERSTSARRASSSSQLHRVNGALLILGCSVDRYRYYTGVDMKYLLGFCPTSVSLLQTLIARLVQAECASVANANALPPVNGSRLQCSIKPNSLASPINILDVVLRRFLVLNRR